MRVLRTIWMFLAMFALAPAHAADAQHEESQAIEAPKAGPGQFGEESDYIVGPGDGIQIFVWQEPTLSVDVAVRPDGKISAPLVDDLVAVGQTPSDLARAIEKELSEFVRSPQVSVIITNPQSAFSKITVIGQVGTPGAVPYQQGMTALDVVLAAGGLGEFAAGNRSRILRKDEDGKEQEIKVKLADLVNKGHMKNNVPMRPGDLLIVPESRF